MAVPRNRMSNARKNSKRAHHAKQKKSFTVCANCNSLHLPHFTCPSCEKASRSNPRGTNKASE